MGWDSCHVALRDQHPGVRRPGLIREISRLNTSGYCTNLGQEQQRNSLRSALGPAHVLHKSRRDQHLLHKQPSCITNRMASLSTVAAQPPPPGLPPPPLSTAAAQAPPPAVPPPLPPPPAAAAASKKIKTSKMKLLASSASKCGYFILFDYPEQLERKRDISLFSCE